MTSSTRTPSRVTASGETHRVRGDDLGVGAEAVLADPSLRRAVDPYEAEALRITIGPFEVVHQRPMDVAIERDARSDCLVRGHHVIPEERRAPVVLDTPVGIRCGVEDPAVLRDDEPRARVVGVK